jgi:hypothetical protein
MEKKKAKLKKKRPKKIRGKVGKKIKKYNNKNTVDY